METIYLIIPNIKIGSKIPKLAILEPPKYNDRFFFRPKLRSFILSLTAMTRF